jgi:hypothetical protein
MKKLLPILLLILTSCEYDYIHENPKHPEQYIGIWRNDSIYINGIKSDDTEDFEILQEDLEIGPKNYFKWEVDNNQLIGFSDKNTPVIFFDIIKEPYLGKMELKQDTRIYYLTKTSK